MMTRRNARYLGLTDRGVIAPSMRADLNVNDPKRLNMCTPKLWQDLSSGGKRLLQRGGGYVGTRVGGVLVQEECKITAARSEKLVRMGR